MGNCIPDQIYSLTELCFLLCLFKQINRFERGMDLLSGGDNFTDDFSFLILYYASIVGKCANPETLIFTPSSFKKNVSIRTN